MYDKPIQLADFGPDLDHRTPGNILDMDNFESTPSGLRVMKKFVPIETATLQGHPLGAYTTILSDGVYQTFVAIKAPLFNAIFRFDPSDNKWKGLSAQFIEATRYRFATFGNYVIAVNGKSPPLIYRDMQDTEFINLSTVSDLPADYVASTVVVVDEGIFLIEAGTDSWWFSLSPLLWGSPGFPGIPSVASGTVRAGVPGLLGPAGPVTAAVQCRNGVALFKANSLFVGQFSGPPYLWNFNVVSKTVGTSWQDAIIDTGDVLLFVGPDEFYAFDGSSIQAIPNNLRDWFFRRIAPIQSDFGVNDPFPNIIGRWDATTAQAFWHYALPADPAGKLSEWISYNVTTRKWTHGHMDICDVVVPFFPEREDGNVKQRLPSVFGIDTENHVLKVQYPDGDPAPAFILTNEFGDGYSYFQTNRIRPIFNDYPSDRTGKVEAFKRSLFGYPFPDLGSLPKDVRGPTAWLTDDGAFNLIQTARSHQFKLSFTGQAEITAIALDFVPAGEE